MPRGVPNKKSDERQADPRGDLANADVQLSPLTAVEIEEELSPYLERGVRLRVDDKYWAMSKGKLSVSGNLQVPLNQVVYAAEYLLSAENYVRIANRMDNQGRRALGDIIDKNGNDITNG